MKSQVVKRSILIAGRKSSVSLEDAFWKAIAHERNMTLSALVAAVNTARQYGRDQRSDQDHAQNGTRAA